MKEDSRSKRHAWAPGAYHCSCGRCGQMFAGDKRARMCADCAYENWNPTHRHLKTGGLYQVLHAATIEATMTPAVVYEGQDGGKWVRPQVEFHDGRFQPIVKD